MNARPRVGLMSLALLAVLLLSIFAPTRQVRANASVSVNIGVFHDALAPYGNWVNHRTYGQVWYPRNVARDWRPYTDGYWAHTPDYGWLWVSYEPWGWAPFHYGRWAWDNWYGWVWVPGRVWAPAWVFWRSGGGYAAWAPMPPNVVWQPGIGLNISYFNYDRDLRWDSWVAVREHDFSDRHLNRRISPPRQNLQIINQTNIIHNVTIVNNNIINQGVPVNQIEAVTGKPVVSVVPTVQDRVDGNTAGQPSIIRLPIAPPTQEEIHHNEELARRLDGKNPDGTRTEPPAATPGQPGNQEPRVPGRLVGVPEPVQAPFVTQEQPNPLKTEPVEQALPLPAVPETPNAGLGFDAGAQHQIPEAGLNPAPLVPAQTADQPPSTAIQPIAPVPPQGDHISAPVPVLDQQPVSTDAVTLPPSQHNQLQPVEPAKPADNQPLQDPITNPQPVARQQTESGQQQIDPWQEQQKQQEMQLQPAEPVRGDAQQIQQQEAAPPQQMQDQPQQQQQVDRTNQEAQHMQQQEAARQQELQNQQQIELQQQQAERANQEAQLMQQQEAARQQELQNQQQIQLQQQQAERANQEAQHMQQQEAARQQELQNQQQIELQQQQAERANQEAQHMQQQEAARQQELQNQQQMELQQQQAERANQEAQHMQQQEAARQQELQNQQQLELQQQQAERANQEAQQMQQQEAARQQELQNQQQQEGSVLQQ